MKRTLVRAVVLIMAAVCLAPLRAWAQLLPPLPPPPLPGGQLIVTLTSPTSGSTVSGTIPVHASVSIAGSLTVSAVQFRLDGANLGAEDTSAPYSVSWNTTTASSGPHTLTAVARDGAGNRGTSAPITVTVNNTSPPDTTPPTASITSPANGATVSGKITVTASASDNTGVAGVEFLLDGVARALDATAPYSVTWDTTTAGDGSHSLTAVAYDAAGNGGASAPIKVIVANGGAADTAPPTVSITTPVNGATVSGTLTVSATASDDVGVVGVEFFLDGARGADDVTAPYSTPWDTTTAANGSHTLAAVARDAAGNRTTSVPVTVNVSNGAGGGGRFEEGHVAVVASPAAAWMLRGAEIAAFSGGTAGSSDTAGAMVTFTFSGTAVNWIGLRCNICGNATAAIDGGAAIPVDTAGAAAPGTPGLASEPVFTASGLPPGTHTLVITVSGTTSSGGAHIVVDAFDVTP